MSGIDISLILTLHREGKYLLRALRSLKEAAEYAQAQGLKVELIAVLDRADELTKRILVESDAGAFDRFQCVEVDHGSAGLSRNDGFAIAAGRYIMFHDGDDLISFNFISGLFQAAERHGPYTIVAPEWLMQFGDHYCTVQLVSLEDITPLSFVHLHPFISRTLFRRDLFEKLQYASVPPTTGYAYADWHFNANAVALGYTFKVAEDAILFYRRRPGSVLDLMDSISIKQMPPSLLFKPEVFLRTCAAFMAPSGRPRSVAIKGKSWLRGPVFQQLMASANQIEPQIDLDGFLEGAEWCPMLSDNRIGEAYFEICRQTVGLTFDHVFLLPSLARGAGRPFADILSWINQNRPGERILLLLGEADPTDDRRARPPEDVVLLDLGRYLPDIGEDGLDVLALKIIQHSAPTALLHFAQGGFGQSFAKKFARALTGNRRLFYYLAEEVRTIGELRFIDSRAFAFLSENLEFMDCVVAGNHFVGDSSRGRLGFDQHKWRHLPALCEPPIDRAEAVARAQAPSNRLLWASRTGGDLVRPIAEKLFERWPELVVEVYGAPSPDFDPAVLAGLPNVSYRGADAGFAALTQSSYLAFVHTSQSADVGAALLEAAAMGIPVIAPDVPAINELVVDGVTGIALSPSQDPEGMAELYVAAIGRLREDPALRAALAGRAYDLVVNMHGEAPHTLALERILER